jgi:hypothetical protein
MKMFILVSAHRPILPEVLESIHQQSIEPEIIDCTYDDKIPKVKRIILAEKKFKETALKYDEDLIIYQQSDILHLKSDNVIVMKNFLDNNKGFGAIALSRFNITNGKQFYDKVEKNVIVSGCTMFTRQGLENVQFEDANGILPSACIISSSLDDAGLKYGYVDNIVRIRHLKD